MQLLGKKKEEILNAVDCEELLLSAKVLVNRSVHKDLDEAVYKGFCEMRNLSFCCKPLSIARAHIQARALLEADQRGIAGFKASDGWFRNWRKHFDSGASVRLFGEAFSAFEPENTINMDETGLFYRAIPARTYLAANESPKTVRGAKALKEKDRVTLVLCVNATGKIHNISVCMLYSKNQLIFFITLYRFLQSRSFNCWYGSAAHVPPSFNMSHSINKSKECLVW